jgi:hypothetical protein
MKGELATNEGVVPLATGQLMARVSEQCKKMPIDCYLFCTG